MRGNAITTEAVFFHRKSGVALFCDLLQHFPPGWFTGWRAVIAKLDGMTGARHRSNCELAAQGVANIASVIFGGMCVTGTIARTATNIRAGARGPIAGMFHCGYLLLFLMIAAPLVSYIPLAALGAVLVMVAWRMAEKEEFVRLLHDWRAASVLLATFGLTLILDLTFGIVAGCVLAAAFAAFDRARR